MRNALARFDQVEDVSDADRAVAFPNIKKTGWDSRKLAEAMLNEAGVACLSGTAFGAFGEGYLRFSIANSMENLDEALNRIGAWAKKNL